MVLAESPYKLHIILYIIIMVYNPKYVFLFIVRRSCALLLL